MVEPHPITHPWAFYVEPFRIVSNLYYVGNLYVSSHLIETSEGLILIDTGFPSTVYLLLESIRALGFQPKDISWILHTHAHYDHMGGTRAIVELTGAKTAIGRADIEVLTSRPELSWAPEYGRPFVECFDVDLAIDDEQVITVGDVSLRCVHTPGHTAGAISYFFDVEANETHYTAGIHGGPGANPLTNEYLARYGLPATSRSDFLASLDRLRKIHVDIPLGSHPQQNDTFGKRARSSLSENPFIDANGWAEFLAKVEGWYRDQIGPTDR